VTIRRPSRTTLVDVALTALLVTIGQLEVWTPGGVDGRESAVIALLATASLTWRSTAPVAVLLTSVGALSLLTARGDDQFTIAQLLGLMLATYTVALLRPVRTAGVCFGLVVLAALANSAAAGSRTAGDYIFPVILLGVPAAAGYSLRKWRERTEQLRRLTTELAAEREAHAKLVVAAERGRIARDLHDSLAQSLNAVVVHAEAGEAALGRDRDGVAKALSRIQAVGRASLAETRQILGALRSDDQEVAGQPRLDQLDHLLQHFQTAGLAVSLEVTGQPAPVPASVDAAAYRIVQESLNNVLRHSGGHSAAVTVRHGDVLEVEVSNEGTGKADPGSPGFGVLGMRERVQLLDGELEVGATADGWRVRARLPRVAAR
jgi:signal transduction histidine kinase